MVLNSQLQYRNKKKTQSVVGSISFNKKNNKNKKFLPIERFTHKSYGNNNSLRIDS